MFPAGRRKGIRFQVAPARPPEDSSDNSRGRGRSGSFDVWDSNGAPDFHISRVIPDFPGGGEVWIHLVSGRFSDREWPSTERQNFHIS